MNLNNNLFNNKGFFQQTPQKDKSLQSTTGNSNFYGNQQTPPAQFPAQSGFQQKNNFETSTQPSSYGMYQTPQAFGTSNTTYGISQQPTSYDFNNLSARPSTPLNNISNTTANMNQSSPFGSSSYATQSFGTTTNNTGVGGTNTTGFGTTAKTPFSASNTMAFGSTNTKPSTYGQHNTSSSSNIWGGSTNGFKLNDANKGSKGPPYAATRYKEETGIFSEISNICAMNAYSDKHEDEIRNEDYEMSRNPVNTTNLQTTINNPSTNQSAFRMPSFSSLNTLQSQNNTIQPQNSSFNSSSLFGNTAPFNTTIQKPQFSFSTQSNPVQQSNTFSQPSSLFSNNLAMPNNTVTNPTSAGNTSQSSFINTPVSNSFATPSFSSNNASPLVTNSSLAFPSLNNNISSGTNTINTFKQNFPPTAAPPASSFFPQINSSQSPSFSSSFNNQFQTKPQLQSNPQPNLGQFVPPTTMQSFVEYSDPYLIKNVKFESFEPQKPSLRQLHYKPIFNTKKEVSDDLFRIRSPAKHYNSNIYTIPEITEENLQIKNLVVVFNGTGKIEYLEPVTVLNKREIEDKIKFKNETVEIVDEPGLGLNKRARVFIENLFPYSRASNSYIKGKCEEWPGKGVQERFIYQLKNNQYKKFIEYDCDTGLYVYEVNHF